jgi:hypothetical protein
VKDAESNLLDSASFGCTGDILCEHGISLELQERLEGRDAEEALSSLSVLV